MIFGYKIVKQEEINKLLDEIENFKEIIQKGKGKLLTLFEIRYKIREIIKSGKEPKQIELGVDEFYDFNNIFMNMARLISQPLIFDGIPVKMNKKIGNWYIKIK